MTDTTPDLDIRTVGDGPRQTAMWLDGTPCMVTGLDEWSKVGDRYENYCGLWRVEKVSDRVVLTREPS